MTSQRKISSFKNTVIGLVLSAAFLPLAIMGYLWYDEQRSTLEHNFQSVLSMMAQTSSQQIQQWNRDRTNQSISLAESTLLREEIRRLLHTQPTQDAYFLTQFRLHRQLELMIKSQPWILDAEISHPDTGEILVSSIPSRIGGQFSGEIEQLSRVQKGQTITSTISLSQDQTLFQDGTSENDYPIQMLFAPIKREDELLGILSLRADAIEVDTVILKTTGFFQESGIKSLDVYLVNDQGLFLSSSSFESALRQSGRISKRTALELALTIPELGVPTQAFQNCQSQLQNLKSAKGFQLVGYPDYRGIPVIGAWRGIPETTWCVIAEVDEVELVEPLNRIRTMAVSVISGMSLLFGFLGWLLSKHLTKPLMTLTQVANTLAEGRRGARFHATRMDEVGQLGTAFNHMADNIDHTLETLEEKIQERTETLAQANEHLQLEILERESAQDSLRASEERYALAIESTSEGIWDWQIDKGHVFYADRFRELLGCKDTLHDESLEALTSRIHPDDHTFWEDALFAHLTKRSLLDLKLRLQPDGSVFRWFRVQGQAVWNDEDHAIRLVGSLKDITEGQLAGQRRTTQYRVTQVLATSETFAKAKQPILHAICSELQWAVGVFWEINEDHSALICQNIYEDHPQAYPHFVAETQKTSFHHGIGLPGKIWKSQLPECIRDVTQDENFPRASFAKQDHLHTGFAFPITLEGQIYGVMEFFVCDIQETDSDLLRLMSNLGSQISQYIERKTAEEKVRQSAAALTQQNHELEITRDQALAAAQAKSAFLATMSHEIRTPMNGVLGMTQLLQQTPLNSEQQDLLDTVKSSGEALLTIINDILDFSKLEAGKLPIEHLHFDLRNTVEETLEVVKEQAAVKKLTLLSFVHTSTPTALIGDAHRIKQIILNLVNNAIKFTSQGDVIVEVFTTEEKFPKSNICFQIRDTGIGISPEAAEKLFEPFSQADSSTTRQFGGTGLGLAICRQLVTLMGGEIGLTPILPKGSCFWFTLPLDLQIDVPPVISPDSTLQGRRASIFSPHALSQTVLEKYTQLLGITPTPCFDLTRTQSHMNDDCEQHLIQEIMIIDGYNFEESSDPSMKKSYRDLTDSRLPIIVLSPNPIDTPNQAIEHHHLTLQKPIRLPQLRQALLKAFRLKEPETLMRETLDPTSQEKSLQTSYRILLAEDNLVNQKVATKMLHTLKYTVDVVGNGLEVLEALDHTKYHLIFMDCHMPEMDGWETTREIRKRETSVEKGKEKNTSGLTSGYVPIIALTANALQGDREQCLEAGMDDFLSKPVKMEDLKSTIVRWLHQSEKPLPLLRSSDVEGTNTETQNASTEQSKDQPPSLNTATLNELRALGGEDDPDFFLSLIDQFLEDIPRHVTAIQAALDQDDPESLQKTAHACKGGAKYMGADRLADLSFQLEQLGRQGTIHQALDLTIQLAKEAATISQLLSNGEFVRSR